MNATNRPELEELLGAYALDAIEPVERYEMEQYLAQNDDARREVDEMRETAALLALLHVRREPIADHVWDDIQAAIGDTSEAAPPANVIALRDRDRDGRAGRRRLAVPLPIAALLVAAASVAIVLLAARHDTSGHSVAAAYRSALDHGAHQVAIAGTSGPTMAHVVQAADGSGYVRVDHMPSLPPGKVYQLWIIAPGRSTPISAGVLGRRPHPYASFSFPGPVRAYALSVENAPGAVTPSTPIGEGTA